MINGTLFWIESLCDADGNNLDSGRFLRKVTTLAEMVESYQNYKELMHRLEGDTND